MIYHITTTADWENRRPGLDFFPRDYSREGFIHCCTREQLEGVLDRYFKGQSNLVLLHLDESKLHAELRYEPSTHSELFPHLYGGINQDAIIKIETR